jgi:hypothetical protein
LRILHATTSASILSLAKLYGVGATTALDIIHGKTYRAAGGPVSAVVVAHPVAPHGTSARYSTGCRCLDCTQLNKNRCREYREVNKDALRKKRQEKSSRKQEAASWSQDACALERAAEVLKRRHDPGWARLADDLEVTAENWRKEAKSMIAVSQGILPA